MLSMGLGILIPLHHVPTKSHPHAHPHIMLSPQCPIPHLLSPQPFSLPGNAVEENQKVKTQWPRSADEPGVYMAQTGMGAVG